MRKDRRISDADLRAAVGALLDVCQVSLAKPIGLKEMTWIGPSAFRQLFTSSPETVQ